MAYNSDPSVQANQLPLSIDLPQEEEQLRQKLTDSYKKTVDAMNNKIGGLFSLQEIANFERWFSVNSTTQTRNGYRKTFKFTSIATGASYVFAHGIQSLKQITNMRAIVYTDQGDWRKVPYVDDVLITNSISMKVDVTSVTIRNGTTAPAIKSGIVVLEYLKQD